MLFEARIGIYCLLSIWKRVIHGIMQCVKDNILYFYLANTRSNYLLFLKNLSTCIVHKQNQCEEVEFGIVHAKAIIY